MTRTAKRVARLAPPKSDTVRVAAYCRVSVAERGEKQFTSITAQREALRSYVASQHGLGWRAVDETYEDDGISGATVERPGFQRMLADARAGKFDLLAVVRFDRLSRSQLDFLRTVEELDQLGVKFVSTSQSFDTSTPMGKCMLGVVSAFAQLERAVISERTKDKMGAARRKGMWTGGRPVLGYNVVDKKLVVDPDEAAVVRRIFDLYLELGGVIAVVEELKLLGIYQKKWTTKSGREQGGAHFEKNTLACLLKNPLYAGCVRAGAKVVEGEHDAILARQVWDAVQRQLAAQAPNNGARPARRSTSLLSGLAKCKCGSSMTRTTCKRHERTYSYLTCTRYQKQGKAACPGSRVAAGTIEQFVIEQVRAIGRKPALLDAAIAVDKRERESERTRLAADIAELRSARGRHAGERERLILAIGQGLAPTSVIGRIEQLDGHIAEADARIAKAEQDHTALDGPSDNEALRETLIEFDALWSTFDADERARVLWLVLEEVTIDGTTGEAEIRLRGGL
jgi:site-specific DNA recombinase